MNKTFRKLGGAFLFFAALSITSCDIVGVPDNASGKFVVKINTEDMVLTPGETASRPSTNATAGTTYTSSDPAVATVDNAGRVTAVAEGTCVITVSTPFLATKTIEGDEILSTATAEYKVIVQPNLASALKEGAKIGFAFNLNGEDLEYLFQKQGDYYELIPQNQPQSAPRRAVVEPQLIPALIYAKTTNTLTLTVIQQVGEEKTTVLTVIFNLNDNTIQIIPGNPLTKVLNFKVRIGNVEITAQLKKKEVAPTGITLNKSELELVVGQPEALVASVVPADATDKSVTWTSDKPEVATVDANGKVTAIAAGEANITAQIGQFSATCKVTVAPAGIPYMAWGGSELVEKTFTGNYTVVENASTDVTWSEGTYVVEGSNVEINGKITLDGNVNLIIKDDAKLTVNGKIRGAINNLYIYGQAQKSGQLDVKCSMDDAIYSLTTLEVHSANVTAISSNNGCGGFYNIDKFYVYGGLVDAKCTAAGTGCGYGIHLKVGGKMNIYGGEVKAEGKGAVDGYSNGITCGSSENKADVKVYGGKLSAECATYKALNNINLTKDDSYTSGKIKYSMDKTMWSTTPNADAKYVKVEKVENVVEN